MSKLICLGGVLCMIFAAGEALASIDVNFGDDSTSWGYYNGVKIATTPWDYPPGSAPPLNTVDEFGSPVFKINNSSAGENIASFDSTTKLLHSITIKYHNDGASFWEVIKPGDLFLDIGGDGTWDYVARTPFFANNTYFNSNGTLTAAGVTANSAAWNLYKITGGLGYVEDQDSYGGVDPYQVAAQTTRADNGVNWSGFDIRDYHPWALASTTAYGAPVGTASFSGWANLDGSSGSGQSTWTFSQDLWTGGSGNKLIIGFTINCANDVLLGDVTTPNGQIPEPASLVIWTLFVGLGLFTFRRQYRRQ
jgi:hypothetical protein